MTALIHGPSVVKLCEAGEEAERRHDEIDAALRSELSKYETPEGIVLASRSWKISARNPE